MCTEKRSYRPAIAPLRVPILDGERPVQYYRISEIRLADIRTKLFDYALAMEHGEREKAGQLFREMQRIVEETKENPCH